MQNCNVDKKLEVYIYNFAHFTLICCYLTL